MTHIAISRLTPDQLDRAWMESEGWTLLLVTHQQRPAMPAWLYEAIDAACGAYWVHEMRQEVRDANVEGVTRPTQRPYRAVADDKLMRELIVGNLFSVDASVNVGCHGEAPWRAMCVDFEAYAEFGDTPNEAVLRMAVSLRRPTGYEVKE